MGTPALEEHELQVRALTWEAEGVLGVTLADPAGGPLPPWEPGAHVDVVLPVPLGSERSVRQYSLCGDPADRSVYRLGVLREVAGRGGSAYVHDVLRPGHRLRVRGPRNHFRLEPAAEYVFVAGGIGITPILPMIAAADARGIPWTLLYGGRTAASMAFAEQLTRFGQRVTLRPQDRSGLLDLPGLLAGPRPGALVYCCGPEPLLAAAGAACSAWPPGSLHVERFAAPVAPARDPAGERAVEVVLSASGRSVFVPPDRPVLEALEDAGIDVLSDCREGICGTCETRVLEGEVDHRDHVLTDGEREAGASMMVCVSRGRSTRLVLDL